MTCSLQLYRARIGTFPTKPITKPCGIIRAPRSSIHVVPLIFIIIAALYSGLLVSVWVVQLSSLVYSGLNPAFSELYSSSTNTDVPCPTGSAHNTWDPGIKIESKDTLELLASTISPWQGHKEWNKLIHITNGNRDSRGIRLAHWNPGSAYLPNKMTELNLAVGEHQPHLLGISEANFKQTHDMEDVQIADYELFVSKTIENRNLNISRVVCYKHNSLVGGVRSDLMSESFSSIWMEIGLPRKKKFLVCQLYREWQYLGQPDSISRSIPAQLDRWIIFVDQWTRALDTGKEVIVMGDCNLDFFKFNDAGQLQPLVDLVVENIYPHGVQQLVTVPTHSWPGHQDTCIDHIYTNTPDKISTAQVYIKGSSDHRLILVTRLSKNIKQNIRYCKKRSYKNFIEEDFLREVREISWWEVYASDDVDIAVDIFTKRLTDILDRMAPIKKFQTRTRYAAWVSDELKTKIKERDQAQQAAIVSGLVEDWDEYKRLRNCLTKELRAEKLSWQQHKLEACEENLNTGKVWKNILGYLNWNSASSPSKLLHDGDMVTSPQRMADLQNTYYINKVRDIRLNMPRQKKDPLLTVSRIMSSRNISFSVTAVLPDEVDKTIRNLKNSKASGLDNLDTYILKLVRPYIVPSVCHIVNLSIQNKKFPNKWKLAKVIPLYKGKGSKFEAKSYRPVAILPILSKVLERVMYRKIITYMDENKLFNPSHHAYRSFHSTTTAMIQMHDTWLEAIDKGDLAGVCMVDMSAAFDVVDTELLLEKMKIYGFDRGALQWMWSYLTYRSQGVYIEGCMSKMLKLEAGVPQGSILGPLFYTIFTNELPEVVHEATCPARNEMESAMFSIQCYECGGMCCYADDSTYTVAGKTTEELTDKLSHKYTVIADFLTDNKLKVNDDKTHLLVMSTWQKRRFKNTSSVRINTPSASITPSITERLLGAQVNHNMKWEDHIFECIKSLNTRLAALQKIQKLASFRTRKMIGTGIFMSKLIYLMPAWGGCQEYLVRALQVVQNKAARSITRLGRFTPTKILLKTCGWLSVKQLIVFHSLVLLKSTLRMETPVYLHTRLTAGGSHPYRTRQVAICANGFTFNVEHPMESGTLRHESGRKLDLARLGWCWRSVDSYNSLPVEIRLEAQLATFKTKLRAWVETNVDI